MIQIQKSGTINKPIDEVWKVLFTEFANVENWVTGVYTSRPGTPEEGYDRVCTTFTGNLYETIFNSDEKTHTYEVDAKGLPSFVKNFTGKWVLTEVSPEVTKASLTLTLETKGILGAIMGIPMKFKLNNGLSGTLNDLATYVETGSVSKDKLKEMSKKN